MQIEYIGHKPKKDDNVAGTGLVWSGHGSVCEVKNEAAAQKLLVHTGIWRQAPGSKASLADAKTPEPPTLAPGTKVTAADKFAGMDDAQVRAYAKDQGAKIKGIALFRGANLRAKVSAALAA